MEDVYPPIGAGFEKTKPLDPVLRTVLLAQPLNPLKRLQAEPLPLRGKVNHDDENAKPC